MGVVTEALADRNLGGLEGLVSAACLAGLRQSLSQLDSTQEQRCLLAIRPEDVFFAFIPDFQANKELQSLLLGRRLGGLAFVYMHLFLLLLSPLTVLLNRKKF